MSHINPDKEVRFVEIEELTEGETFLRLALKPNGFTQWRLEVARFADDGTLKLGKETIKDDFQAYEEPTLEQRYDALQAVLPYAMGYQKVPVLSANRAEFVF